MNDPRESFRSDLAALVPQFRRFAFALTRTRHDADDLVQSAFERALLKADQFTPGTRLDSWVYRIMQNLWIDQTRSNARRRTETLDAARDVSGEDGRVVSESRLLAERARRTFATMPEEQRAAAVLVIVNGLSYAQAAATLEVPIGTIMSRVSRARAVLVKALGGAQP